MLTDLADHYPYFKIVMSSIISLQVSASVAFLLSPAAAFITGTTIVVDGGQVLHKSGWEVPSEW